MTEEVRIKNTGLRGVTVADSGISFIDGEKGILIYRGYRIEDLADHSTYLETAYLLLHGSLPSAAQLSDFMSRVRAARQLPAFVLASLRLWPREASPMDVLQACVPLLAMAEDTIAASDRTSCLSRAITLVARMPTLVAAWHRIRNGQPVVPPDDGLDHAANFLWMLQGQIPDAAMARDLDVCLILHADHTFNASTFAARQVVSTRASLYAGVAAGIGALSGGLHGSANARVMQMLLELEHEEDIEGWVRSRLDRGEVIMGFGHAVYKTGDPRAVYLKRMGQRLAAQHGGRWQEISQRIEEAALANFAAQGKRGICANVDFNSAPVYYLMGIPLDLMTPLFAVARVAGWCAHIMEEQFADVQGKPALYRPQAEYVGEYCGPMGCVYNPPDRRG